MERNFNNRDFEQFVKQNADQYRMFPSEKVWKSIHNTLHTRKRWLAIGLSLLLLSAGTVTWIMLNPSGKKQEVFTHLPVVTASVTENNIPAEKKKATIIIAPVRSNTNNNPVYIASPDNQQQNLFLAITNPKPIDESKIEPAGVIAQNITEPATIPVAINQPELINKPTPPSISKEITAAKPTVGLNLTNKVTFNDLRASGNKTTENVTSDVNPIVQKGQYPFTIESVVNSYKHARSRKRLSWQVYVAPTVSYRKLEENQDFLTSARMNTNSPSTNVNNAVTHKPDVGLEMGFRAGYPISKKLTLTGGLQFNISKYDIRAYSFPSEVATIALNSGGGANSVSTMTNYRNYNGTATDWLHNLYITASAPIGAELKLTGNKKTYFGMGGTLQPTYILAYRAYLLSTDYKNYVEVPSLIRRWNLNSSFEMFAGYSTGKIKWKVGPQVRYQVLSSFLKQYPVKEHLFDFGLKVGVMLAK